MKNGDYTHKVAAGLRRVKNTPDAFLFCGDCDTTWDLPEILGIPVYHSALIVNTCTDMDVPFIPMWVAEGDYIVLRGLFNDGYAD